MTTTTEAAITVAELAHELDIKIPSFTYGTATDWLLAWDQSITPGVAAHLTDDTPLSADYADMIRTTWKESENNNV